MKAASDWLISRDKSPYLVVYLRDKFDVSVNF